MIAAIAVALISAFVCGWNVSALVERRRNTERKRRRMTVNQLASPWGLTIGEDEAESDFCNRVWAASGKSHQRASQESPYPWPNKPRSAHVIDPPRPAPPPPPRTIELRESHRARTVQ